MKQVCGLDLFPNFLPIPRVGGKTVFQNQSSKGLRDFLLKLKKVFLPDKSVNINLEISQIVYFDLKNLDILYCQNGGNHLSNSTGRCCVPQVKTKTKNYAKKLCTIL